MVRISHYTTDTSHPTCSAWQHRQVELPQTKQSRQCVCRSARQGSRLELQHVIPMMQPRSLTAVLILTLTLTLTPTLTCADHDPHPELLASVHLDGSECAPASMCLRTGTPDVASSSFWNAAPTSTTGAGGGSPGGAALKAPADSTDLDNSWGCQRDQLQIGSHDVHQGRRQAK